MAAQALRFVTRLLLQNNGITDSSLTRAVQRRSVSSVLHNESHLTYLDLDA